MRTCASSWPSGWTAFEIGSVTKVFTALLLADMARRGEVALEDPAAEYLPTARIPDRNGRAITLLDLATHTSGLPFMPEEVPALDQPTAARYEPARLYEALASRAAMDYDRLLQTRVIAPLGLESTFSSRRRMRQPSRRHRAGVKRVLVPAGHRDGRGSWQSKEGECPSGSGSPPR